MRLNTHSIKINPAEVKVRAVRAQGPGGQNVNKVATAIHLYFDIPASTLPEPLKAQLLAVRDSRLTRSGVLVIKSQNHRSRERNLQAAHTRLQEWLQIHSTQKKKRRASKPKKTTIEKRLKAKKHRGDKKALRKKVDW